MKSLSGRPGAMELLRATGWEYHYGHLLLNHVDIDLLEAALATLRRVQNNHPEYLRDHSLVERQTAQAHTAAAVKKVEDQCRRSSLAKVPKEPPEGAAGAAKICIHLGPNKHVWRRFDSTTDTLQDLLNFVKSLEGAPSSPQLENITQAPHLLLDQKKHLRLSLHHLDLWPAGHIRVSCSS